MVFGAVPKHATMPDGYPGGMLWDGYRRSHCLAAAQEKCMGARLVNGRKKKKRLAHRKSRLKAQESARDSSETAGQRKR